MALLLLFAPPGVSFAATPEAVQRRIEAGENITFVDVRSTDFYQKGHLPGAINVPAAIVADKRLPRLGRVIAYDDGLGGADAIAAAARLNLKPGIQAEVLEGGYAGWVAAKGETTTAFGMSKEEIPQITYQKLASLPSDDAVLVDLRKPAAPLAAAGGGGAAKSAEPLPLTDLRTAFPGFPVTRSPFSAGSARRSGGAGRPLLVLIDNGDGSALETARALRANGNTRFVILAGGEEIIARKGQPGSQRLGHAVTAPPGFVPPAAATNRTPVNPTP